MVVVFAALAPEAPAAAAPGDLDPAFSGDGKQTTDFGRKDQAHAIALQPDGRIVVAGTTLTGSGAPWDTSDFALARYAPDGALDPSFAGDGMLTSDFAERDEARAVAVQPDGKIVVAGMIESVAGTQRRNVAALVRYNADGSLDDGSASDSTPPDAFGTGGKATLDGPGARAIALTPNGQIVLATGYLVARFNHDGSLDAGFGAGGTTPPFLYMGQSASALALQPDGRIIAAGDAAGSPRLDFGLSRLNVNGSLDGTFAGDGRITTDFGADDYVGGVAVQPDGKIVAAGATGGVPVIEPSGLALARYNADGSLDDGSPSDATEGDDFGDAGKVITPGLGGGALAIQADGRIVVVAGVSPPRFALARYRTDGSLDRSFAGDGIRESDKDTRPWESTVAVALQADGGIVVAGFTQRLTEDDFAVARYLGRAGPSAATLSLRASLTRAARALRRAGVARTLRQGGARIRFAAPMAGVLRGGAIASVRGRRRATAATRLPVMTGMRRFATAESGTMKLKLTPRGRRFLKRAQRAKLKLQLAFVDFANATSRASATVRLRR